MNPTTNRTFLNNVKNAATYLSAPIAKIINAGTAKAPEEDRNGLRLLNFLSLLTSLMVYGIGIYFYSLVRSKPLIIGVLFEGSVFLMLFFLTTRYANKKIAAYGHLAIHTFSAVFFGALLGMAISTELVGLFLMVFLVLSSFFVFKDIKVVGLNLAVTGLLMIVIEYNNFNHVIEPIKLDHNNLFVFRWFSIGGMFVLTFAVCASFIKLIVSLVKKIAEVDSKRKEFLVKTSHELKSPLSTIIIEAGTHIDKVADPSLRAAMRAILNAATHGSRVVNNIMELSKIESGKPSEVLRRSFDVKKFADQVTDMMKTRADNKNQTIKVLYVKQRVPKQISSDETMIVQIMLNLLTNSIKYAPMDTEIFFKIDYLDGNMIIRVSNAGLKMDPIRAQSLFDTFVSSDYTANGGTGLGLVISKQYAEALGGTLTLEISDEEGKEINFVLTIPAIANEKLPETENPYINPNEAISILRGKKVLLIDDEKIYYRSIKHLLNMCDVFYEKDCRAVIATAESIHPDLILLDNELNQSKSGLDLLLEIKQNGALKDIPIMLITADTDTESRVKFLNAGAADVFPKPLEVNITNDIRKHFADSDLHSGTSV